MLKLIINKLKYQSEYEQTSIKDTYLFEKIIKILDELIIKNLRKREVEDEDIYQDILIKIEKVMLKFVFKNHNCHIKNILFSDSSMMSRTGSSRSRWRAPRYT